MVCTPFKRHPTCKTATNHPWFAPPLSDTLRAKRPQTMYGLHPFKRHPTCKTAAGHPWFAPLAKPSSSPLRGFKQPLTRISTEVAKYRPFQEALTRILTKAVNNLPFKQPLTRISTEAAKYRPFKQPLTRISTEVTKKQSLTRVFVQDAL